MLNLALGTYFVVDELVVPVEVLLLLLVNRWRVVVGVLVAVVMLISIVVVVVVVAVEWGTQGWTSLSARRRANAVVMTLRVMMIIMMIVVVLAVLALLRYKRIRWIGIHKIYHNTSATIGRRRRQIYSADPLHNELITATATRRIEIRRGTGTALLLVVQHTDGTVLTDTVRHLIRIDPDRQLQRQHLPQRDRVQTRGVARPLDDRIHLAVDAQAAEPGTLRRHIRIPVAGKVTRQNLLQRTLEMLQLNFAQLRICLFHSQQIHHKVRGRIDFYSHFLEASSDLRARSVLRSVQTVLRQLFNIKL